MTRIETECQPDGDGWRCRVVLSDDRGMGEHVVRLNRDTLERLAPGAIAPDDLVRRSFKFLLEREPRASILREFDLPLIGRYFPEYEEAIRAR